MNAILKATIVLLAVYLFPHKGFAQSAIDTARNPGYLFNQFVQGTVLLKSGRIEPALLNYDATKQGIAFQKDGTYFDLTGLETIDTVYVTDKKFVPAKGIFYEVTAGAPVELYTTYTCKMEPVMATAEHSGGVRKTNRQVSNTVSDVYMNRPYRGDYAVEFRKQFWIRRYRDFYKVNTMKQVIKLFPRKENDIEDFVKTNNTNFSNPDDLIQLLRFCSN